MRRPAGVLLVAVLAAVPVAGCTGGDGPELSRETIPTATSTPTPTPTPEPTTPEVTTTPTPTPTPTPVEVPCTVTRPDTRVTWATYGETAGLDPIRSSGGFLGGTELAAIYDVLVRHDPDTGGWVPHLAASLTSDDTGAVWTLGLRDGVVFDSGAPLDAAALVASFERFDDPDIRNPARAVVSVVESVEAVDALTVRFTLTRPWWDFPSLLADEPGMIVDTSVSEPAGVGPYVLERSTPGRELVLVARPDYWGGPVCVETLRFVFVPGPGATAEAFVDGGLDVAYLRGPDSGLETARTVAGAEWPELLGSASVLLVNHGARGSEPVTASADLRRAVALAVDPTEVVAASGDPTLAATTSILHPDQLMWSETLGSVPVRAGADDPAAAAADIVAGFDDDVTIRLICPNDRLAEAETVAAALESVGLDVDLQIAASVIGVVDAVVAADYDLACWDLSLSDVQIGTQLRADLSSSSGANRSGFATDEVDALLDRLDAAPDVETRRGVVAELGVILATEVPWVPLAARTDGLVAAEGVTGVVVVGPGVYSVADLDSLPVAD